MKYLVVLALLGAVVADPVNFEGIRSKEEVDELREFLYKTQQDSDMTLEEAMSLSPNSNPLVSSGKFDGDILLRDEEIEEMVAEYAGNVTYDDADVRNGMINTRYRWPGNTVIYDIAPNTFNAAQTNMIIQAANVFQPNTCTRWVRRTNQRDYVYITGRNDGCYAHVGYFANFGRHTLNLAPGCFNIFIVLHEMLHSMGFHHMHQSYARYDWVRINWQYITRGMEHNFNIFRNNVITMLGLPYEYASNQHYANWAFANAPGRQTIVALRAGGQEMGQLNRLTGWDVWRIARLYNCPGAWSVEVRPEDAGKAYNEEFYILMKRAALEEERRQALAEGQSPPSMEISEEEVKAALETLNPPVKSLI